MIAVIKTGGKQYRVEEGSTIYIEKIAGNAEDKIVFNEVLVCGDKIGNPYVEGAKVEGTFVKNGKQSKIRIYKYVSKSSKSNRRTMGHRQPYTKVTIDKIIG